MKLIYVASPYAGDVERNVEYAKQACHAVMKKGGRKFIRLNIACTKATLQDGLQRFQSGVQKWSSR